MENNAHENINAVIADMKDAKILNTKKVSDKYHTFGELYIQRLYLFSIICSQNKSIAWKSKKHFDEENDPMFKGDFIVGLNTPKGPASYHFKLEFWDYLAVAIGKYSDNEIMGKPVLTDKSNINHLGISKFPFIITKVKAAKLKQAIEDAKSNPNLLVADYPKEMFETKTDEELISSIESKENDKLEYLGAIIYGRTEEVNKITGRFQLWKID